MSLNEKTLRGQRVLVTGGAGFVGSHIVDLLVEEGCERILVVDNFVRGRRENLAAALPSGRVELIEGESSVDRAPREGIFELTVPTPDFERIMWQV